MKIVIGEISRKEVDIKNGRNAGSKAWKVGFKDKLTGDWYNAWANDWNKDWKIGQSVEFEFKQTQYGKDIIPPQRGQSSNNDLHVLKMEMVEIKAMVEEIYRAIVNRETDQPINTMGEETPF